MSVNKSASKIGTVEFANGNRTTIWIGANSNTGETIVWHACNGGRARRCTGENITHLATDLDAALNEDGAKWVGEVNDAALDCLAAYR